MGANWIESIYYILGQVDLLWPEDYVGLKSYFLHQKFLPSYQAVNQEVCPNKSLLASPLAKAGLMLIIETLKGF